MNRDLTELLNLARDYERQLPDLRLPPGQPDSRPVASWIDHTLLKPEATPEQIEQLCKEALEHRFATVCVNPIYVPQAYRLLQGSPVGVCTVVGFPLGATLMTAKAEETRLVIEEGATEVDMVVAIGLLKGGQYEAVAADIRRVVEVSHARGAKVKVLELAYPEARQTGQVVRAEGQGGKIIADYLAKIKVI